MGERTSDMEHGEEGAGDLLGTDRSLFRNVSVRDPRHNTDHYMVVGRLHNTEARDHAHYIKGRRIMPLKPPKEPTR